MTTTEGLTARYLAYGLEPSTARLAAVARIDVAPPPGYAEADTRGMLDGRHEWLREDCAEWAAALTRQYSASTRRAERAERQRGLVRSPVRSRR